LGLQVYRNVPQSFSEPAFPCYMRPPTIDDLKAAGSMLYVR
jgi:hypothetical protein